MRLISSWKSSIEIVHLADVLALREPAVAALEDTARPSHDLDVPAIDRALLGWLAVLDLIQPGERVLEAAVDCRQVRTAVGARRRRA